MPLYSKLPSFDPASVASKLPRPLQWPAGAVLGGLKSVLGGDDPTTSIMGAVGELPLGKTQLAGSKAVLDQLDEHVHPAVKALVELLGKDLPAKEIGPASGRITPMRQIPSEFKMPEGFRMGKGFDPAPFPQSFGEASVAQEGYRGGFGQSPRNAYQQGHIKRYFDDMAPAEVGMDPRRLTGAGEEAASSKALAELKQQEMAPIAKGVEELRDVMPQPQQGQAAGRPRLLQDGKIYRRSLGVANKRTFADLSQDEIRQIQREAAAGEATQQDIAKKHKVGYTILTRVLREPWRD